MEADVVLADGVSAHIRGLRDDDIPAVRALYERVSRRTRYLRFFTSLSASAAANILNGAELDDDRLALVAEIGDEIVGIAEYQLIADDTAEVAVMVHDDHQGRGLGTIMLERLAVAASACGIRRFVAEVLVGNRRMHDVLTNAGFTVRWSRTGGGVGEASFELVPTAEWLVAHADREHTSVARSIGRIMAPSSVAVIGASRHDGSIGRGILDNLVHGGLSGTVYAVNPHASAVAGVESFPSVLDIPGPVDLAVIAVPASAVLDVVRQCTEKGVHGVVVISGGFAELPGGAGLQHELVALARRNGMRVVGPNCVGVINTNPGISMNATFSPVAPQAGRLGFASQSGGIGIELLARAKAYGLGISTFVSLGNKADVSGNDLLQYWAEDADTDVILLYLESFGNPRKFARLARDISRHKPIIAMKSGRTLAGARGARSHTAALADVDVAVDELLHHAGVIRVDTLEELFDTASLVAHQPLPAGPRVAIMSNGGGPAILAADACVAAGLEVPELSAEVQGRLRAIAPPGAGVQNPVDLIASARADVFRDAADILIGCDEIDALLVIYVAPLVTQPGDVESVLIEAARHERGKPIAACFLGVEHPISLLNPDDPAGRAVPTFAFPESAAQALGRAARLGAWRRRPEGIVPTLDRVDTARARELVAAALGAEPDGAWVSSTVATEILSAFGVPMVTTRTANTAEAAVAVADHLGYPVVLKAASSALLHKTDVGGVRLGLATGADVREAFTTMARALGDAMGGALVQPMAEPGVELIVGITRDPQFGPLVVFGMGGVAAELQRDTALRLPPLTDVDVREMLGSLRGSPLLFGYRGSKPVDTNALGDLLGRISRLAEQVPELTELDCNPVIASPGGVLVVDVKLRLTPDPRPRTPFDID